MPDIEKRSPAARSFEQEQARQAQTGFKEESTSGAPAPLVDEALAANRLWKEQEEVNALQTEVARLQDAVVKGVPRVGRLAIEEIARTRRDRPLMVAVMIGAIAFLMGATR
ncbi:hypothetical protein [Rhizobium sp. Leaf453]|uniref:hypothetical protein n=1 Tax=Rhizobium sp. Leaf453 TaxID=1736380 RepID=UPI000712555A|nr:hypothetical protein [Rhizobium sp. Leaf453]KQU08103.1 hypothetical protein ASG68_23970 [Rhizobium sp. Leaf453]